MRFFITTALLSVVASTTSFAQDYKKDWRPDEGNKKVVQPAIPQPQVQPQTPQQVHTNLVKGLIEKAQDGAITPAEQNKAKTALLNLMQKRTEFDVSALTPEEGVYLDRLMVDALTPPVSQQKIAELTQGAEAGSDAQSFINGNAVHKSYGYTTTLQLPQVWEAMKKNKGNFTQIDLPIKITWNPDKAYPILLSMLQDNPGLQKIAFRIEPSPGQIEKLPPPADFIQGLTRILPKLKGLREFSLVADWNQNDALAVQDSLQKLLPGVKITVR